ncbi:MAG: serine acetyltransferase [Lachnospiraceae bacterium]|nr:serine acetyltransferase [Lachnospiraceae bacterium]
MQNKNREQIHRIADILENEELIRDGKVYLGFEKLVQDMIYAFLSAMFPAFYGKDTHISRERNLEKANDLLTDALMFVLEDEAKVEENVKKLFDGLPEIYRIIKTDIQAAYEGDPAAKGFEEVILSYPAFKAICIYRIAHELYQMQIPLLPRVMTEYAHRITGIDIHPGATIGEYFFIDHGTGVVVGETTTIGHHVKLYQHVTLGAKSFAVQEDGTLVKGLKRHPDIGNHVVIYSGATILGGKTSIGDHCVIGGNVWLTSSLPAGETVTVRVEQS